MTNPWAYSPLVSNVPSLPHQVSFQAIGIGSGILGYRQSWCPSFFSFAFHILVFSIHSSSPATGFHSCFFFTNNVSVPIQSTYNLLTFLGEFPGLGLGLAPDVVVPEAEQGEHEAEISFQISALAGV